MKSLLHPREVIGQSLDNTLHTILCNQYITYLAVSLLIIYIGLYHTFTQVTREKIHKVLSNPIVITGLITLNFVMSFYNMLVALMILIALVMTFSPRNMPHANMMEGFAEENVVEKPKRHRLLKHFDIPTPKSYTNAVEEGIAENRRIKAEEQVKEMKAHKTKKSNNSKERSIMRRKFDPNSKDDKNLLNTREICRDIINRIDYKYENRDYLLKYISSRLEEIVDLNRLLDDDTEDDD
jgi:hypothetical protein